MDNSNIIKVTTTVTKPDDTKLWWPTGAHIDDNWYNLLRVKYLWPGYILNSTDLFGSRSHGPTHIDSLTISWTRWWYSIDYLHKYSEDKEINVYRRICHNYWSLIGAKSREQIEEIKPKYTSNGYRYIGDGYFALKHFNSNN